MPSKELDSGEAYGIAVLLICRTRHLHYETYNYDMHYFDCTSKSFIYLDQTRLGKDAQQGSGDLVKLAPSRTSSKAFKLATSQNKGSVTSHHSITQQRETTTDSQNRRRSCKSHKQISI